METPHEPEVEGPKYKVGEWVYTYIGRVQWPFKVKIDRVIKEEYGVWSKKFRIAYGVRVPEQEWAIIKQDWEISRTQSGLTNW